MSSPATGVLQTGTYLISNAKNKNNVVMPDDAEKKAPIVARSDAESKYSRVSGFLSDHRIYTASISCSYSGMLHSAPMGTITFSTSNSLCGPPPPPPQLLRGMRLSLWQIALSNGLSKRGPQKAIICNRVVTISILQGVDFSLILQHLASRWGIFLGPSWRRGGNNGLSMFPSHLPATWTNSIQSLAFACKCSEQ